jgi:ankyrin repeat protein
MSSGSDRDFFAVMELVRAGSEADLDRLARGLADFPHGVDPIVGDRWILLAITEGSLSALEWMIRQRVELGFRGDDGYTPLLCAIESRAPDRELRLELLLAAGAPVNQKGINDWTPAHMAAARDDVAALRILVRRGADLTIRTEIDDYATPLEKARNRGCLAAVRYLESVT